MAKIRPFKGIRPISDKAALVAALPYDVLNSKEAREITKDNPYSFLHVDKAEIDLDESINLYDTKVYEKARDNLNKMISDGILIQDATPAIYIYKLTMNGKSQTGLVVCTDIDEYMNGTIKRHELTRADKEQDRINHVDYCNANTGPIFLAYKEEKNIEEIITLWTDKNSPVCDFVADDGISHCVWIINSKDVINSLIKAFEKVSSLYIADGHHRNASAVKVGLKRRESNPNFTGEEEFNYYLSVLFSEKDLRILDYNRVVKDLNGLSDNEFLDKLKEKFIVEELSDNGCFKPKKSHEFGMYLNNKWYRLNAKNQIVTTDHVLALDVSILQNEVLIPLLGIKDVRTDKRIDFVGGIRGLDELEKRVDSKEMSVAFSMFPTAMSELMDIADTGEIMPPKSTWFEPKLRSGLFIHSLED